jgi:hypothetical protein
MKRFGPLAILLAAAILFFVFNHRAYKGFFQDDEMDNIVMTRAVHGVEWLEYTISPKFSSQNFRPVGHVYFRAMDRVFGLNFPRYVVPIQLIHLLNGGLLWVLLRRLGIGGFGASAGAAFFLLSASAMDAYWKPMYVFDLLCATFILAALIAFTTKRWWLAILAMWLAYKSKELAVMLPLAMAAYELWFGQCRWKRLIPFFAISLLFGIQSLLVVRAPGNPYSFVWSIDALQKTITFYSSRILLYPFAGLAFLAIPLIVRNRRAWMGAAMLCVFFLPLLFLPGRIYAAYTYLPLTGAAVELGALAEFAGVWASAAFFLLWVPLNYLQTRTDAEATLKQDKEVQGYVTALVDFSRAHRNPPIYVKFGTPAEFHDWGIRAAISYPLPLFSGVDVVESEKARDLPAGTKRAYIQFDRDLLTTKVILEDPSAPKASYIAINNSAPSWQLGEGWYDRQDNFCWIAPRATAVLGWPKDGRVFELVMFVPEPLLAKYGHRDVRVRINGTDLGVKRFDRAGRQVGRWELPVRSGEDAHVEIDSEPEAHVPPDPRPLGVVVVSFGVAAR